MRKTHSHLIKYLRIIKEEQVYKTLDRLLELKIIGKKEYKSILNEVLKKEDK